MSQHEQADQQLPELVERETTQPKTAAKRKRVIDDDEGAEQEAKPKRVYKKKKVSHPTGEILLVGFETGLTARNLRWFSSNAPVVITKRILCYESSDSSSLSDSE